jgi:LacI family transcriptional regulator
MAVESADGFAGGEAAMREILDSGFRPTAVACVNDVMAFGALRELHARDLDVPRDVSVTGFDNIALAEFARPALTTADLPRDTIGRLIFDALVPPAGGDRVLSRAEVVVESQLIVRDSTARPRQRSRVSAERKSVTRAART